MKRFLALALFVLIASLPAHAQKYSGPSVSEGGQIGTGSHQPPVYPSHAFNATNVSGSESDFEPSTFRSYDQAVNEGRAALAQHAKTLTQIAEEKKKSDRPKAKIAMIQDGSGKLVLESYSH